MADPNAGIFTLIYVLARGAWEMFWMIVLYPFKRKP